MVSPSRRVTCPVVSLSRRVTCPVVKMAAGRLLVSFASLMYTVTFVFCCDAGWSAYEGHCYKYFSQTCSGGVNEALVSCRRHGGKLLLIDDVAEENFISTTFNPASFVYVALTDNEEEDVWRTFEGQDAVYLPWYTNQPDSRPGTGDDDQQNCVVLHVSVSSYLDIPCRPSKCIQIDYVCEVDEAEIDKTMRARRFPVQKGRYLWGYSLESARVPSMTSCVKRCMDLWPVCISVNYRRESGPGVDNCVLNNGTHREFNRYYLPNPYYPSLVTDVGSWAYGYFDW